MGKSLPRTFSVAALVTVASVSALPLFQGRSSFYYAPVESIGLTYRSPSAIRSAGFVSRIGGVAFANRAAGFNNVTVTSLTYLSRRSDGQRLRVGLSDGTSAVAEVPDWQIKPIADFVEEGSIAAFTLFGRLVSTPNEERARLERDLKERYRAMLGTLSRAELRIANLTMRLATMNPELGGSEDERKFNYLFNDVFEGRALGYHPAFKDTLLGIRIWQADSLIIDRFGCEVPYIGGKAYRMRNEATVPSITAEGRLRSLANYQDSLAGPRFDSYVICDLNQQIRYRNVRGRLVLTGDPYWHCWRRDSSNPEKVIEMPQYSRQISEKIKSLDGINPAVYDALRNAMRLSALFRDFRARDRRGYIKFVATLNGVRKRTLDDGTVVRTPTVYLPE